MCIRDSSLAELLGLVEALIVLGSPRVFTRARQRSRVDHIKSRLKASTLPEKDTACHGFTRKSGF